jgi:uncharacterized protein (DUF486 family)
MLTVLLLFYSNTFMTIAWYGHLRFRDRPLVLVILVSWLIAFAEYCFQVPANRIGYGEFTGYQLKIIQEILTLIVFAVFCLLLFGRSAALELRRIVRMHRGCSHVRILGKNLKYAGQSIIWHWFSSRAGTRVPLE